MMDHEVIDELRGYVNSIIENAPMLENARGLEAWERSFDARSKWFRGVIDHLCTHQGASYTGSVGDHSLTIAGKTAHVRDGYAQLLKAWVLNAGGFSIAAGGA